ncbi:universal stress protein [bacterium]|nr:universal stress protein [bacterium]
MLSRLLVAIDLSRGSVRVVRRAARLPVAADARLDLLHVVSNRLPAAVRASAAQDARRALAAIARRELAGRRVRLLVVSGAAAATIASQARAARAELVVVGRVGARPLRDTFVGSNAERVLRRSRVPVLVVRREARGDYRRPLLAIDFDQAAPAALDVLPRLLERPPLAPLLVHVDDPPLAGILYPSLASAAGRPELRAARQRLERHLAHLVAASPAAAALPWRTLIRVGSPRLTVPPLVTARRIDLLALGTRARAGIAQLFLGTVAGDLLRAVPCDVLLVPPRASSRRARARA